MKANWQKKPTWLSYNSETNDTKQRCNYNCCMTDRQWQCQRTGRWAWTCRRQSAAPSSPMPASCRSLLPAISDEFSNNNNSSCITDQSQCLLHRQLRTNNEHIGSKNNILFSLSWLRLGFGRQLSSLKMSHSEWCYHEYALYTEWCEGHWYYW